MFPTGVGSGRKEGPVILLLICPESERKVDTRPKAIVQHSKFIRGQWEEARPDLEEGRRMFARGNGPGAPAGGSACPIMSQWL